MAIISRCRLQGLQYKAAALLLFLFALQYQAPVSGSIHAFVGTIIMPLFVHLMGRMLAGATEGNYLNGSQWMYIQRLQRESQLMEKHRSNGKRTCDTDCSSSQQSPTWPEKSAVVAPDLTSSATDNNRLWCMALAVMPVITASEVVAEWPGVSESGALSGCTSMTISTFSSAR